MPANKYAQLRYRIIDRCLTNRYKPYPSKEELRQACEEELYGSDGERISLSTIDKDLYAMRNEINLGYEAPIAYHPQHKGYYYTDPEYTIQTLPLGEEDVKAIEFAANTLSQFRGTSLFDSSQDAIEKILGRVKLRPTDSESREKFVYFDRAPVYRGGEYLSTLLQAIREQHIVRFSYAKFSGGNIKQYTLHPYLLKEYRNRWYVVGLNPDRDAVVVFGLDRIEGEVTIGEERFERHPDFDIDRYFEHSMGITAANDPPETIRLRFTPLSGKYVESRPWHPSQKVVRSDETIFEIELFLSVTKELIMEILSYGSDVQVMTPDRLRTQIGDTLRRAAKFYR